ncbi:hypothetical protein Tco_1443943 [Tanacetum coccineum]
MRCTVVRDSGGCDDDDDGGVTMMMTMVASVWWWQRVAASGGGDRVMGSIFGFGWKSPSKKFSGGGNGGGGGLRRWELARNDEGERVDLSRSFHSLDTVWLTPDIQRFISREGKIKCKFPWIDDYTVGRNFWLTLVCFDPTRKGWLSEEHIDLWVDYIWHGRPDNANWAMVSYYFVQILLQNSTPLFYANGDKYATPWSDVDQVIADA